MDEHYNSIGLASRPQVKSTSSGCFTESIPYEPIALNCDIFGHALPPAKVKHAKYFKKKQKRNDSLDKAYTVIPSVKILPARLIFYNRYEGIRPSRNSFDCQQFNEQKGVLSSKAQKRLDNAIDWLLYFSPSKMVYYHTLNKMLPFKIGFVTLTLSAPQVHSDLEIKEKCLNQFIIELRKIYPDMLYIWKAEAQYNGNIHFHFVLNKYIKYQHLRRIWNRIIEKLGYVHAYTEKFKNMSYEDYYKVRCPKLDKDFESFRTVFNSQKIMKWSEPNTVDVHAVNKVDDMKKYLSAYFKKNEPGKRLIEGNIWRLSERLSKFKGISAIVGGTIAKEVMILSDRFKNFWYHKDYINILKVSINDILAYLPKSQLVQAFNSYVAEVILECAFQPASG